MHKDPDTRMSVRTLLEANGYNVIEVVSFKDFLAKVNKNIDLVIINGLMPRDKIVEVSQKNGLRVAYFLSAEISEEELSLYKNVVGGIDEPHDIKEFLRKIKVLIR